MKKAILSALFAIITLAIFAQSPLMINYQAVLHDNLGNVLLNEDVSIDVKIIQGSAEGTEVFSETHAASTNDYGQINLVIGTIEPLDAIDWSGDDYFIQIWLDGTEMGTSQLLSVPYALHSKTAETVENLNIVGDETAFDNWDKDATDDFSGDYNDLTNQPTIPENLSELTNDEGFISEFTELDGDPNNEIEMPTDVAEGDMSYYNGSEWVKIVAPTTEPLATYSMEWDIDNNKPYWKTNVDLKSVDFNGTMYIYPVDNSDGVIWGTQGVSAGATSSTDGSSNTDLIVVSEGEGEYAASVCANLVSYGYDDWYLPSIDELDAMYQNQATIDMPSSGLYWSSTESGSNLAKEINFNNGTQIDDGKNFSRKVRCVRRD